MGCICVINWIQRFLPSFLLLWGFFPHRVVCCSFESDCSLEYVSCINQIAASVYSCTNQIAASVYSCTNQIAAFEYVSSTKQIAALVYSCTNQNAALVYSCTNHSVRELPLMPIMPYNDWVASKTSLAVFRFQINNRWKFFFSQR